MSRSTRELNQTPIEQRIKCPRVEIPMLSDVERAWNKSVAGDVNKLTLRTMSAPALNKTEQRWHSDHPSHLPFPLRLRWGKCMNYAPDFMGICDEKTGRPILIEVKGGHIFDRGIDIDWPGRK